MDDRDGLRLRHMLRHARLSMEISRGRSLQDILADQVLQLAIVHLLEIIGEAASRVSADTRASYPQVPWRQIVGLRNRLIHGYDSVDVTIVWQILTGDIPPLVEALAGILGPQDAGGGLRPPTSN